MTISLSNQVFGCLFGNSVLMDTRTRELQGRKWEQRKPETSVADQLQTNKECLSISRSAVPDSNQPTLATYSYYFIYSFSFRFSLLQLYQALNHPFLVASISEWKPGRKDWKEGKGHAEK